MKHPFLLLILLVCVRLPAAEPLSLLPARSPGRFLAPAAQENPTQWLRVDYDDRGWQPVLTPVGFDLIPPPVATGVILADSVAGFSGIQGSNGWSYGFYARGTDTTAGYDPGTEFVGNHPDFGFLDGAWRRGVDGRLDADPPWDFIGPRDLHPNFTGGERWVIRRFTSPRAGRVRIAGLLGNVSGQGGTTARLYLDGTLLAALPAGAAAGGYSLLANLTEGSRLDFAVDPNGSDAADLTRWTAVLQPATESAALVGNAAAQFSGTQGADQWHYGFYNRTLDADGHYDAATDFRENEPGWALRGGEWNLGTEPPPWTCLGARHVHPSGANDGEEHWPIRRWVSPLTGPVTVDWHFAKDLPYGEGATLLVLHNGRLVDQASVAGDDRLGALHTVTLRVRAGDSLDFACTPAGPDGEAGDGADRCLFQAFIHANAVPAGAACITVADSGADWSTNGIQGERGWYQGYCNRSQDPTPGYQAADFVPFPSAGGAWSPTNFWRGFDWDWNPDPVPCLNLGPQFAHPSGTNSGPEYWAIRRWVSSTAGRVRVQWFTRKSNPFGSGVTGKFLHNGLERDSASITAGDVVGVQRSVDLADVAPGDTLDLALTPTGPAGQADDRGDRSLNGMTIISCLTLADTLATDVGGTMSPMPASSRFLLRLPFAVEDPARLGIITLRMRCDDGFVAWLNGVEIARRNAGGPDNGPVACRTVDQALALESIVLADRPGLLGTGTNLLAIEGWNCRVDDPDFLLAPELWATRNEPPAVADDYVAASLEEPLRLGLDRLLGNDRDPEGDGLSLVSVTAASAGGGTVTLAEGAVTYRPPPGSPSRDRFGYRVADSRGLASTGTVHVVLVSGPVPEPNHLLVQEVPGGLHLRFLGEPGTRYEVQRSSDLKTWAPLGTWQAPEHGLLELEDAEGAGGVIPAFYRMVRRP